MKNYLNYLYVLKWRQDKNYVDYLNTAINYQNAKVKQVDDEYASMTTAYNDAFKTQSAITTDDYNRWYTVLTDMYNKLDGSLSTQLDLQKKQADIDNVYAGMSIDAINAQTKQTPNNTWTKDFNSSWLNDYILSTDTKTKDQLLPGVDLTSVIARATDQWLNPQWALDSFQRWAKNSINASAWDASTLNGTMNNIVDTLRNFNSNTKWQYTDQINNIAQGLGQQTQYQLDTYIWNNAQAIVSAIKDLGNNRNKTVDDFIRNHPTLDSTVAKQLFNYYKSNPEYANKPQMLFSSTWKISESDIPWIKSIIAKSLSNSWANDLTTSINQY